MSDLIKITDSARARIQKLMTRSDDKSVIGIQIGVKNAGCSGMSYTMDYAKEIKPHDEVLEINDIKIIIDSTAVMFLVGTELDYKDAKLESTFVFNNPNATSTCGCGESFAVN
tara:strand:- start:138 stop:476 length:339 start_codon:yes stop_codon:yes gene_type:complete